MPQADLIDHPLESLVSCKELYIRIWLAIVYGDSKNWIFGTKVEFRILFWNSFFANCIGIDQFQGSPLLIFIAL